MKIEWKPAKESGVFGEGVCAEVSGMRLVVSSCDTEKEGLHVFWMVQSWPDNSQLCASGRVCCSLEHILRMPFPETALQPAYEEAKKRAEAFARVWEELAKQK